MLLLGLRNPDGLIKLNQKTKAIWQSGWTNHIYPYSFIYFKKFYQVAPSPRLIYKAEKSIETSVILVDFRVWTLKRRFYNNKVKQTPSRPPPPKSHRRGIIMSNRDYDSRGT